jgi:hypothetical protein
MLGRKIGILVVLAATISLTAQSSFSETIGCRTNPGAPAPQGMHWYYRVDRTNDRHCWYLDSAGIQVSERSAATSNPTRQNPAKQARTSPENDSVQTVSPGLASAETVPDETPFFESSVGQRVAPASAETVPREAPFFESSVGEPAAMDFMARWLDLPRSVDLNMPEFATPRNNYADEHGTPDLQKEMPSTWFAARVTSDTSEHTSTGAKFGSVFLAGALGMLLYGGALKLTRLLHSSGIRRRPISSQLPYDPVVGLRVLLRGLRRAEEGRDSPRSFAPSSRQIEDGPNGDYLRHRARSAFRGLGRDRVMV